MDVEEQLLHDIEAAAMASGAELVRWSPVHGSQRSLGSESDKSFYGWRLSFSLIAVVCHRQID